MFRPQKGSVAVLALALSSLLAVTGPALAGYAQPGYDLQVVKSEQGVEHGAVSYLTNPTWGISGLDTQVTTSFTLSACQDIRFARLYLDIWGGTRDYTSAISATLNGTPLGVVNIKGYSADDNPTFDAAMTCVYGTGSGMWQVAYSGVGGLLHTDGTANVLSFTVTDPGGSGFDGRTACASLVAVYTDPGISQTLDYYLAEADGTVRKTPGTNNSPAERSLTFAGLDTDDLVAATYVAGYTHGTAGQNDQLYFNGHALGDAANDIALGTTLDYGPSNHAYDVTGHLAGSSTVRYSVAPADVGSSGEGYLRPNISLLEVVHPLPEPATICLLALGAAAVFRRRTVRG